jgi:L-threonylcarbamoyladenylate synthase
MIDREIREAARVVSAGGTILYPTDTIWGIGCTATDPGPVDKVYRIKQRSDSKSMLVLVSSEKMLSEYLLTVPEQALELVRPASRPTTVIYPGATGLAANLLAGDGTVGIRITRDEFCCRLIDTLGHPLVSTSANISGMPPPSSFREIDPVICRAVDYVVNWRQEDTSEARPSTVLKIGSGGAITILRP